MPFSGLRTIGFTDHDIVTYELLLKEGDCSKEELMGRSDLKKEKFDESIAHLLSYGAIEVSGGKITLISPKIFLQRY